MTVGKIENGLERGFVKNRLNCLLITDPKFLTYFFDQIEERSSQLVRNFKQLRNTVKYMFQIFTFINFYHFFSNPGLCKTDIDKTNKSLYAA